MILVLLFIRQILLSSCFSLNESAIAMLNSYFQLFSSLPICASRAANELSLHIFAHQNARLAAALSPSIYVALKQSRDYSHSAR